MALDFTAIITQSRALYNAYQINKLIEENSSDDTVNLIGICRDLNIKKSDNADGFHDWSRLSYNSKKQAVEFYVKPDLCPATKKTLLALACAEYILTPDRIRTTGINYDMFSLENLHNQQRTYRILLATRLVMTESTIAKVEDPKFPLIDFCESEMLLQKFVRASLNEKAATFCLLASSSSVTY